MLHGFVGLAEREFLNHAVDTMHLSKSDGFFRVKSVTGRPTPHIDALQDHREGVDGDFSHRGQDEDGTTWSATVDEISHDLRVGSGDDNQVSTTQLLQSLGGVLLASVDVVGGAELRGEVLLGGVAGESNLFEKLLEQFPAFQRLENTYGSETHFSGILYSQMTKASETLDGHRASRRDLHLSHGVEDGDTSTKKRSSLDGVDALRNSDSGFDTEENVFGVCVGEIWSIGDRPKKWGRENLTSTVLRYTIDGFILAHLE